MLHSCALEKYVYSAVFRWNALKILIKSLWSGVSFKAAVSLLIFSLDDLSIEVNGVLESLTVDCISVILSLYVHHDLLYTLGAPMLGHKCLLGSYPLVVLFLLALCSFLLCLLLYSLCFKVSFVNYTFVIEKKLYNTIIQLLHFHLGIAIFQLWTLWWHLLQHWRVRVCTCHPNWPLMQFKEVQTER